ncbi:MAG: HEAT repeat domain-containing protein [Candidatus Saganbacteria bacterium]|nr:HEAT repeat domain-containing protein [Candidatus Saganbacteria bacterium]
MCNLKLIAFNMLESVEGIPSARELVGILRGEIPEGEREAVINQLRLFGLPLTRIGLRRMLGTERQAELRRSFRGSSPQEIMTKLADMFYGGEFLQELLGREEEASKKAAAWWLGEIGDFADALGTLYNLIGDTQVELGNIAAEAYMKIEGRRGGIDGIRSHLNHEKSSIRAACAKTLKEVGTAQDLEPLQQRLQVEGLPNLRIALGEAFAWATFREKGIAAVRTFIFNACEQICAGVAQVLGEYGEPGEDIGRLRDWLGLKFRSVYCPQFAQAVVVLTEKESGLDGVRELLTDSNVHIRKAAAERMGEIGDIGDIERLGLRLWGQSREQESEVRKAAGDAIVSILKRQEPAGLDEALVRNSATLGFLVREYQAEDVGVSREIAKMIQVGGHAIYQGDWESILSVGAPSHDRELFALLGKPWLEYILRRGDYLT